MSHLAAPNTVKTKGRQYTPGQLIIAHLQLNPRWLYPLEYGKTKKAVEQYTRSHSKSDHVVVAEALNEQERSHCAIKEEIRVMMNAALRITWETIQVRRGNRVERRPRLLKR